MLTPKTQWLREAGFGLMFHYLDKPASSNVESPTSSEDWNRRVDAFDVASFTRQVNNSGAGYVIFTLGQNTGHFCAPNSVYDDLVGVKPSLLSKRDLIAEIAASLAPEVKLIAYLPSHAPANHREAISALRLQPSWDGSAWGLKRFWPDAENADDRLSEFQTHGEAIIAHWGQMWGDKVHGWWIDGCYFADRMYRSEDGPNFASFAWALRAGNQKRILAFNSGTAKPLERLAAEQDYTAGEFSNKFPAHDVWTKLEAETDGMQTQLLSFLGEYWGRGEPRFPDGLVSSYTQYLNQRGIAMTWDVPFSETGIIPESFLRQLEGIPKK
jgi:hypothetical protein